jgi:hypothetical protein
MDRDDWKPSVFDFPEADHGQSSNPPTVIGAPVRLSSPGEILAWHSNDGSLNDTIREYCGIWRARGIEREIGE